MLNPLRGGNGARCLIGLDLLQTGCSLSLTVMTMPGLTWIAGDVDLAAVDGEVAVADQLTRLAAGHCKAQTVNNVVQTALEEAQQVLTGLAGIFSGLLIVGGTASPARRRST